MTHNRQWNDYEVKSTIVTPSQSAANRGVFADCALGRSAREKIEERLGCDYLGISSVAANHSLTLRGTAYLSMPSRLPNFS